MGTGAHEETRFKASNRTPTASLIAGRVSTLTRFCSRSTAALTPAGSARIFPRHLAERGAGGFLFLQRRQRLAEPQQRVRRLGGFVELGGHAEEGFGGVAILLALEIALPSQYCESATRGSLGYFCAKFFMVSSASA